MYKLIDKNNLEVGTVVKDATHYIINKGSFVYNIDNFEYVEEYAKNNMLRLMKISQTIDILTAEKGLNKINERIRYLKNISSEDVNTSSLEELNKQLDIIKEINILEGVIKMFEI